MVTLFTIQFLCSQFFHNTFSYITSRPIINFNNTNIRLESDMCDKYFTGENPSYELVLSENQIPTTSIILDFELSCETVKLYFLDITYYFGNMLGSCIAYHFYEKVGSKISLFIFTLVQIICFFLFQCLNISSFNSIYFLYVNLFLLGFSEYIVINLLFLYICDIINLTHIPLFITIIISGRYLAGLIGTLFFHYLNLNWKTYISIIGGLNTLIFIIMFSYMESSPKAALRNNNYMNFIKHLLNISKKNKKNLKKEDFDFLLRFMDFEEQGEYDEFFHSISQKKINILKDEKNFIDDDEYKDLFLNIDPTNNFERKSTLKDDYLMSEENNKIGSVKTLFNETKMKDYSFFDFFKFIEHLTNFGILTFFWAVYNFIKSGLEATTNEIPEYYNHIEWSLLINIFGLISLFLIMLIYTAIQSSFHKILVSIQLLTFI